MDEPRQILASTTETSLTAQSSHLFQNAAGFDIVGGHFVSGDLHYHAVPESSALGPTHRPLTLPTPTPPVHQGREAFASSGPFLDVTSEHAESEIYCSQLLRRKRGFPLYVPGPQRNLPTEYQRKGVSIGDVGRVTPEGVFDFFFNIYLPADHPINANDVPEDFSPLTPYVPKDLVHVDFDPGSYVSSYSVQELDPGSDSPADIDFPGSEFRFNCKGPTGALLSLPHGAQLEKLENVEHARRYAAKNAESWYRYVNGTRGRRLVNGDLYLITGCEKSQSGGMASFENVTAGSEFQLLFKPITSSGSDAGYKYRFKRGTPAHTRTFFSSTHLNHTTFIHGLTISIGEGIWGRLLGGVGISQITDFQSPKSHSNFVPFGSQGSLFSWSLGFFGGGAATGGGKYRGQSGEEVGITDLSLIPKIFHPGRLINNLIFRESPDAKVVITHDDDWGHILHDDDTECTIQNGNEFLERILEMFAITEEDGATFIVFKPDPNLNIGELEESAMPVSSLNSLHSIISSHTSYNLGQRRKDELPLQQHRTYTIPSLTSKKEIPAYFATRRSLSQPSDEEEDELTEEPPAANVTDQEKIEYKRRQNTLPARRSRKRKLMHQQQLEEAVERCLFCRGRQFACMPAVGGAQGCGQCQARSVKCEYPSPSRRRTRKWGGNDDQGSSSTPTSGLDLRNTTQSPQHHAQITPRPASDSARDSGKHRQEFAGQGRSRSVSPHRERPSFVKDGSMYDLDSILESASNPPSIDEININLGPSDMDLILQQANELFYPDFTDARPPPRIPEHSFVGPSDESLVRYLPRSQSSTNYLDKLPSHGSYDIIPMEVSVKRGRGRPKGSRNKQAVPAPAGEASSSAPPRKRGRPPKEKTEGGKAEDKSGSSDDLIQIRRA